MYILGLSAFYHDSAACIIHNGEIIAAAQEERFTRIKHDKSFPTNSIKFCVEEANIQPKEITNIVFYEKPFLKFERLIETYLAFAPLGFESFKQSMPLWIKNKLFQKHTLIKELQSTFNTDCDWEGKLLFSEHHLSHAASAYYPSPFNNAAILTMDGVGEWTTTSIAIGSNNNIEIKEEIYFPHSIGLLYSAFTYYLGFKVNGGEYKLMGLAPYGKPKYSQLIKDKLIKIAEDGSFRMDLSYFNYATGLTMTNDKFDNLFDQSKRDPEGKLTQQHMDIAASIQEIIEEIIIKIGKYIVNTYGSESLCLAGGVALNCVANAALARQNIFKEIWIQPAAGDAGGALGAALAAWYIHYDKLRPTKQNSDGMKGALLGPSFSHEQSLLHLKNCGARFSILDEDSLLDYLVNALVENKAIGLFRGKMEFGPRALGSRSIIANPMSENAQSQLNLKIKFRESFRPFAPSVLREHVDMFFEDNIESPYMLYTSFVKEEKRFKNKNKQDNLYNKINKIRSEIPAVTHVDFSSRIQTITKNSMPFYHSLITRFYKKTGCPMVVNTSFNVRGEPMVCSPTDAFNCFMGTDLDILVVENFLLIKAEQDQKLLNDYSQNIPLD